MPSDCRCGDPVSFELRTVDGNDDACDEVPLVDVVGSEAAGAACSVSKVRLGVWRCKFSLERPGRFAVRVRRRTADDSDRPLAQSELRCAPGSAAGARVKLDTPTMRVGTVGRLRLLPLDACGNVTPLETNRQLGAQLVLDGPHEHTIEAFVSDTGGRSECTGSFFPTRVGVYRIRPLLDGEEADGAAELPTLRVVASDGEAAAGAAASSSSRSKRKIDDEGANDAKRPREEADSHAVPKESAQGDNRIVEHRRYGGTGRRRGYER